MSSFVKFFGSFFQGLLAIIDFLTLLYLIVLVAAFIIRLFRLEDRHEMVKYVFAIAEPPMNFIKKYLPDLDVKVEKHGTVDLTPMVIFLGLSCIRILLEFLRRGFY
jgi:uncharacterized protein YggT (Ycf19 family)